MCSPFWRTLQTPSVSRRNARERNRVKQVNCGFNTLRNHIPHLKNKVGGQLMCIKGYFIGIPKPV